MPEAYRGRFESLRAFSRVADRDEGPRYHQSLTKDLRFHQSMEKIFAVTLLPRLKFDVSRERSLNCVWNLRAYFPLYVTEQTSVYGTERQRRGVIKKLEFIKGNKV